MEVNKFVGKVYDEVLNEALETLKLTIDDVIVSSEEKKMGLFKGTQLELTVTPLTDIIDFVKDYLQDVLSTMGLEVSFETSIREKQIKVRIYSNDNPLLIGASGRNLDALQVIVRSVVKTKFGKSPYISLDV